jgi:hypothetical protein
VYRLVDPLGGGRNAATPNVWKVAVDSDDQPQFVAKAPSNEDNEVLNWPAFSTRSTCSAFSPRIP